jgi:hypothetical protein
VHQGRVFLLRAQVQLSKEVGMTPASPPPRKPFKKRWLSYAEQVALLQSRGLIVADPAKAADFLKHLNYYRFSGYCLAFEQARHPCWS